jgi:hypothetical protein
MAEAENNTTKPKNVAAGESIAVVVPLFPRLPSLQASLATLREQTRRPDLVILLDDGSNPDAETLGDQLPDLNVEVVEVEPGTLAAAVNSVVEYLAHFEYLAFLQAGDSYHPERLERCVAAMRDTGTKRPPVVAISRFEAVDARGQILPPEDPRAAQVARQWAPSAAGASLATWLGTGNFAGPVSNIFIRRSQLAGFPLPEDAGAFSYHAIVLAGVQGLLAVLPEPLLRHHMTSAEREPSLKACTELLRGQLRLLLDLKERLAVSPETRRNLATFHHAAWNNLSGLREDIFQQLILRLAAGAAPEEAAAALDEILRSRDAATHPPHWRTLHEGADPLDLAAYSAALQRTRDELFAAQSENERLGVIAAAAQDSGWVRFGAWLGNRSARLMMELEETDQSAGQSPDRQVEGGGEGDPQQIRHEQETGHTVNTPEGAQGGGEGQPKQNNLPESESGAAQAEEERRP